MNEKKKKHLHDFQMRKISYHMIPEIYVNISGTHMIMW